MYDLIDTLIHVAYYMAGAAGLFLVVARFVPAGRELVARLIGGQELWFAFAAALLMTLTSLYLSEIRDFIPCRFCWYQRACAYPNVAVLLFAALRRDRPGWIAATRVAVGLATIGIFVSTWHILLDVGWVAESSTCDPLNPCTVRWGFAGDGLGHWFATIQTGAFCCFLFIIGVGLHALAKPIESPVEA